MRLALSLLLFAVVCAVTAIGQEMEEPEFYTSDDFETKEGGLRQQMMTLSLIIPVRPTRQTIMEWTTSTSTLVCTKYTDTPCSVRTSVVEAPERPSRRPARPGKPSAVSPSRKKAPVASIEGGKGIMIDEDYADQFAILPSRIQRVESTQLPKFSEREARAADPQYVLMYRNPNQDIEPGFQSDLFKSMATPMNRRYSRPVLKLQRQFLQNYWTVTRRSTITEVTVSTSVPLCSATGSVPQCAISDNFRC